jgi:maltokinase
VVLEERRPEMRAPLRAWALRHRHVEPDADRVPPMGDVDVTGIEPLRLGEAELWGVSATIDDRPAHAVVGLCDPEAPLQALRHGDDPVLGFLDDGARDVVLVDALAELHLAVLTVEAIVGVQPGFRHAAVVADRDDGIEVSFDERWSLTAFPWPYEGSHPGVVLLTALDEAGFNHLPAPVAIWRRGGRDLGIVQEVIVGSAPGDAVALTSLRDLYASGLSPEQAGGDFAPEAEALGTMAARMHLALAGAFGSELGEIDLAGEEPASSGVRASLVAPILRTHGDLRLQRTARSDQGWVLQDTMPGGCDPRTGTPVLRTPLADVADMVRSFHDVAQEAAQVRDPTGRLGATALGEAWERRNAAALLRGYRETPGIDELLPADRSVIDQLVARLSREQRPGRPAH